MTRKELEERTRRFAVRVIVLTDSLRRSRSNHIVARQIVRSATSIGANYREALHAESRDDFVHKLNVSSKEAAETVYWLEILNELCSAPDTSSLLQEGTSILRILNASVRTIRQDREKSQTKNQKSKTKNAFSEDDEHQF